MHQQSTLDVFWELTMGLSRHVIAALQVDGGLSMRDGTRWSDDAMRCDGAKVVLGLRCRLLMWYALRKAHQSTI